MNRVSLNFRQYLEDATSPHVPVVLLEFRHPDTSEVLRLSTDSTERITDDPLVYGTRSSWRGADPATEPYLFAMMDLQLPGDMQDAAPEAQLFVAALDSGLSETLRSFVDRAPCHMAVVLAATPNTVEIEFPPLVLIDASLSDGMYRLTLVADPVEEEEFPAARFTQDRFPGLFR